MTIPLQNLRPFLMQVAMGILDHKRIVWWNLVVLANKNTNLPVPLRIQVWTEWEECCVVHHASLVHHPP